MRVCNACGTEKNERRFQGESYLECKTCRGKKILRGRSFHKHCWSHFGRGISDVLSDKGSDSNRYISLKIEERFAFVHGDDAILYEYFVDSDGDDIIVVMGDGNRTYLEVPIVKRCESSLATFLKRHCLEKYPSTIVEFQCLRNPETGYFLPFDIFIDEHRVFIEINGQQHYEYIEYWHRSLENFHREQRIYTMKREYAMSNGHLIEIRVDEFRNDFASATDILDETISDIASKSFV